MIYKVRIENKLDAVMTIMHEFEKIVDTPEEAIEFGREAGEIALSFNLGFGGVELEESEDDE